MPVGPGFRVTEPTEGRTEVKIKSLSKEGGPRRPIGSIRWQRGIVGQRWRDKNCPGGGSPGKAWDATGKKRNALNKFH